MMQKVPEGEGKKQGWGNREGKGRGEEERKREVRFTTFSIFLSRNNEEIQVRVTCQRDQYLEIFMERGIVPRLPHAPITAQSCINSGSLSFGKILKIYHMTVCVGCSEAGEYLAHFSKAFKIHCLSLETQKTPPTATSLKRKTFLFFSFPYTMSHTILGFPLIHLPTSHPNPGSLVP